MAGRRSSGHRARRPRTPWPPCSPSASITVRSDGEAGTGRKFLGTPLPAPTTTPPGVDPAAATAQAAAGAEGSARAIERVLATAREQLSLDVSFLSEWVDGKQVFRGLDGDAESFGLHQDEGLPLADSYCIRVFSGELPAVIPDASQNLVAAGLAVTAAAGIGAYVGVPVTFTDGRMYGMLCCLSHAPDPSLRARDTKFLHVLARLLAEQLEERDRGASRKRDEVARIRAALEAGDPAIVVQPIVDLRSRRTVGYEALSRFASEPRRTPDVWFADAAAAGLGIELELLAARRAIEVLADLPADAYLAINLSPDAIVADGFGDLLAHVDPARLVVEITEHAEVHDYGPLVVALARLRAHGVRLSIDDAGAGFASFRHILRLAPEVIKLDISLTSEIDHDPAHRAVARAIVALGREFGTTIVAEGIETASQLAALRALGVPCGQGYFLGRPAPPSTITAHPDPIAASGERASLIRTTHRRGPSVSPALAGHGAR
jgi:EAL domain-containing protein (putative c-di-GMP-specific phosphodiesterase class I)